MEKDNAVELLTVGECAKRLGLAKSTTYKMLVPHEPGVHRMYIPGSRKPIIRVESSVVDRILRRSSKLA